MGFRNRLNDLVVRGDIRSANWDGGLDLSGGPDAGATQGFFLDSSAGAAQFQQIYARGGELHDLTVTGDLILSSVSGRIATAAATAPRVELRAAGGTIQKVRWFTLHSKESQPAEIRSLAAGPDMSLELFAAFNSDNLQTAKLTLNSATAVNDCFVQIWAQNARFLIQSDAHSWHGDSGARARLTATRLDLNFGVLDFLKLPVKTTTGDPAGGGNGDLYLNTFDNALRQFADGLWRSVFAW